MSPRPRKASDQQVFDATGRLMSRLGPAQLTLADIAAEAGLTAGALVQRFGSKRGLLLAFAARESGGTEGFFEQLRATHPSPLATLRAYADCMAQLGETPGALARSQAWLQQDLTDPAFRRHTVAQARATRLALKALLRDAVAAGELAPDVDADVLARLIQATLGGSLLSWGFYREGSAASWVHADFAALLAPYLARARPVRRRARRG